MSFVTRAYNTIVLDKENNIITKSSTDNKLINEINFYLALNFLTEFQEYFAEYKGSNRDLSPNFFSSLKLKYYPYDNLGKFLIKENDEENWKLIARKIKKMLDVFFDFKSVYKTKILDNEIISGEIFKNARNKILIEKTELEYKKFKENNSNCEKLFLSKTLKINNVTYDNFYIIWPKIKEYIEINLLTEDKFNFMHGDMCFSNILCNIDKENKLDIRLVDPRGHFGIKEQTNRNIILNEVDDITSVLGDTNYDLAKLMHSIDGKYDLIIIDHYEDFHYENNEITFKFKNNCSDIVEKIFEEEIFNYFNKTYIKLIQGLLFISMCDRHYDSPRRQKIMYATGVRILNEALNEIDSGRSQ